MYRNCIRFCTEQNLHLLKGYFSTNAAANNKWDLLTAVCLERKPIVTPRPSEMEEKFQKLLAAIEFERSLKSDHELQHELDLKKLELIKRGDVDKDIDISLKNTAQDFADACVEELSRFKPAAVVTEDDKSSSKKSLNRKLDKHLVLLVNQKIGNKSVYLLPQGQRQDGETLKQTAERILKTTCGPDIKVQFFGNAPCGFYKYYYPKPVQKQLGSVGAKVFFYIAKYRSGEVSQEKFEYKWLDRQELNKELPSAYGHSVAQFLIDEN